MARIGSPVVCQARAMTPEMLAEATGGATGLQVIDPDELADSYWRLYTDRDRVEYRFPAPAGN
jgi:hypothetical protein